jgi:hypothetical protein
VEYNVCGIPSIVLSLLSLPAPSLLALCAPGVVSAQVYVTPSGSSTGGGSVSSEADFTISNGQIVLVLKNLTQNPTADSQLLSGITFNVAGASGSGSLTTVNSGKISTINSNGTYSAGVSDSLTRWTASETGTAIGLTTLSGGTPNRLIIGPDSMGNLDPTLGGEYTNANPSITNNHNPSVLGSATFTISVAGVTSNSILSNVVFDYGTTAGSNTVAGTLQPNVPEPGVNALLAGLSVSGLGILVRRRARLTARSKF